MEDYYGDPTVKRQQGSDESCLRSVTNRAPLLSHHELLAERTNRRGAPAEILDSTETDEQTDQQSKRWPNLSRVNKHPVVVFITIFATTASLIVGGISLFQSNQPVIIETAGDPPYPISIIPTHLPTASEGQINSDRAPTFTWKIPAPYVYFNAITDDPMWGDERDFIRAADESWGNEAPLANEIEAKDGHSYLLTMLVHNNAAPNLDLAARGVAGGIFFDEQESSEVKVRGSVKADNCGMSPNGNVGGLCQFIDEVRFWSESPFSLRLIPGSAVYTTNGESFDLPDTVVNAGATLGDVEPTGDVIGGTSVSGYLTLRVIAVF